MPREPRTTIKIALVIKGDARAAFEAINRALDAGDIQGAIASYADEDAPDISWDIVEATAKWPPPRMQCRQCGLRQRGNAKDNVCGNCGGTCDQVGP